MVPSTGSLKNDASGSIERVFNTLKCFLDRKRFLSPSQAFDDVGVEGFEPPTLPLWRDALNRLGFEKEELDTFIGCSFSNQPFDSFTTLPLFNFPFPGISLLFGGIEFGVNDLPIIGSTSEPFVI